MCAPFFAYSLHYYSRIESTFFSATLVRTTQGGLIALDIVEGTTNIRCVCFSTLGLWKRHLNASSVAQGVGQGETHVVRSRQLGNFASDANIQIDIACTVHSISSNLKLSSWYISDLFDIA